MTDMREAIARAIYDADEDAITASIDSNPNLSEEAKREWHKSIGPKVAWEDVHPETREAYLARADAALSLMQPEIDRRVAEERAKLLERLRGLSDELEDDFTDAIGDSLDVDWGPRDGARNCVIAFNLTLAKFEKENSDG